MLISNYVNTLALTYTHTDIMEKDKQYCEIIITAKTSLNREEVKRLLELIKHEQFINLDTIVVMESDAYEHF